MNENESEHDNEKSAATWGPKLFYAALIASLVFFWWLVIYDHGVKPLHGG